MGGGGSKSNVEEDILDLKEVFKDFSARGIAKGLRQIPIEFLYLGNSEYGDDGVRHIAKVLETNDSIKVLDLSGNSITDIGVKYIVEALEMNPHFRIEEIYLDNNKLTHVGATLLIQACNQADVVKLSLKGMQFSWKLLEDAAKVGEEKALRRTASEKHVFYFNRASSQTNMKWLREQELDSFGMTLELAAELLGAGFDCYKYKYNKAISRCVWCDGIHLLWNTKRVKDLGIVKGYIALSDIYNVSASSEEHKSSDPKFIQAIKEEDHSCISVATAGRTLDLGLPNSDDRDIFLSALCTTLVMRQYQALQDQNRRSGIAKAAAERNLKERLKASRVSRGLPVLEQKASDRSRSQSECSENLSGSRRKIPRSRSEYLLTGPAHLNDVKSKRLPPTVMEEDDDQKVLCRGDLAGTDKGDLDLYYTTTSVPRLTNAQSFGSESDNWKDEENTEDLIEVLTDMVGGNEEKMNLITRSSGKYRKRKIRAKQYLTILAALLGEAQVLQVLPLLVREMPDRARKDSLISVGKERKILRAKSLKVFLGDELKGGERDLQKFYTASSKFAHEETTPEQFFDYFILLFGEDKVNRVFPRIIGKVKDFEQRKTLLALYLKFTDAQDDSSGDTEEDSSEDALPALQKRKSIFGNFDKNDDGKITWPEFQEGIKKYLAIQVTEKHMRKTFKKLDTKNVGYITREDFKSAFNHLKSETSLNPPPYTKRKSMFTGFDLDQDGKINFLEFKQGVKRLHINVSEKHLKATFQQLDTNKVGYITRETFTKYFLNPDKVNIAKKTTKPMKRTMPKRRSYKGSATANLGVSNVHQPKKRKPKTVNVSADDLKQSEYEIGFEEFHTDLRRRLSTLTLFSTEEVKMLFEGLDPNKNGVISRNEYDVFLTSLNEQHKRREEVLSFISEEGANERMPRPSIIKIKESRKSRVTDVRRATGRHTSKGRSQSDTTANREPPSKLSVKKIRKPVSRPDNEEATKERHSQVQKWLSEEVDIWLTASGKVAGEYGDIRTLLKTLHVIFPFFTPADKFALPYPVSYNELKKKYHKVIMLIHPDKNTKYDMERRIKSNLVFAAVQSSYKRYVDTYCK